MGFKISFFKSLFKSSAEKTNEYLVRFNPQTASKVDIERLTESLAILGSSKRLHLQFKKEAQVNCKTFETQLTHAKDHLKAVNESKSSTESDLINAVSAVEVMKEHLKKAHESVAVTEKMIERDEDLINKAKNNLATLKITLGTKMISLELAETNKKIEKERMMMAKSEVLDESSSDSCESALDNMITNAESKTVEYKDMADVYEDINKASLDSPTPKSLDERVKAALS